MAEKLTGAAKQVEIARLELAIKEKRLELENLIKQLSEIAPFKAADYSWGLK